MLEVLKKIKRVTVGKDFFYKTTKDVSAQRIGSDYGGWWIATDDLKTKKLNIFSFGLGEDISFDIDIIKKYDARLYGFDPTPKSVKYVESMNLDERFTLYKYALSDTVGTLTFNLPENENHVSGSLENISSINTIEVICKDLQTICKELDVEKIDILKMDIEGSEYKVVENILNNKIFPAQILIEYHHFFDSFTNKDTKQSIELLLEHGYDLFHIDGYNYSFLKK